MFNKINSTFSLTSNSFLSANGTSKLWHPLTATVTLLCRQSIIPELRNPAEYAKFCCKKHGVIHLII